MKSELTNRARVAMLLTCVFLGEQHAVAQPTGELETVATRERSSLDPLGIRAGGFRVFPEVDLEHARDDNVFATPDNALSDSVTVFSPAVTIRSDWSRNSLEFGLRAASSDYSDLDSEDHDDRSAFVRGRWETANDGRFYANWNSSVEHEGRESVNDARGLERTRIDGDEFSLGFRILPGRLLLQAELEVLDSDFHDVPGFDGVINNDDRDRSRRSGRVRAGYEVSEGYAVFLQLLDRTIDHESEFDDNGYDRDADGFEAVLGAELDITDVILGDIYFGRKSHSYDDPRFADIGGNAFGIAVEWNLSGLTTLKFEGRREVEPTTIIGASGVDETRFGIGADHELLRNLILSLDWSKRDDDFQGIDRRDENRALAIGARYLMNRKFEIGFEYVTRDRDSTTSPDREFSRDLVSLRFTGQL